MEKKVTKKKLKELSCIQLAAYITELTSSCGEVNPSGVGMAFISELASRLSLTPMEALFLSTFVDQAADHRINYRDLARQFDVRPLKILIESDTLKSLAEKQIIIRKADNEGDVSFRVHPRLLDLLLQGKLPECQPTTNLRPYELMDALFDKLSMYDRGELTEDALHHALRTLLVNNMHLDICSKIQNMDLRDEDLTLLLVFAMFHINRRDFRLGICDIEDYFSRQELRDHVSALEDGTHPLMANCPKHPVLVEYACADGLAENKFWRLNQYCMTEVFAELKLGIANKTQSRAGLKKHEDIDAKELFYPEKTRQQVDTLQNLLNGDKMKRVLERLSQHKLRKGFSAIFYGHPGTGKTETLLQLARKSGRDIMMVDCSQIRDKFVGESEKNIKAVFDLYRQYAKENEMAPILCFNEADSLFTKRKEGADHSVDKMENAIAAIILNEMETLEGILIATTNLTGSLDSAFERRFLYKVEFEKPTANERMQIWKSQMPELSDEEALTLAKKFDTFAGGQIENISRKYLVTSILADKEKLSLSEIEDACRNEMLSKSKGTRIGFAS